MPSKSPAQARLMRAVAHGWKKPGGGGPTRAVAKEFVNADKRRGKVMGYQFGGITQPRMQGKPMGPLSRDPRAMPPQPGRGQMRPRPMQQKPMGRPDPRAMPPVRGGMPQKSTGLQLPPHMQRGMPPQMQKPMGRPDPRAMPPVRGGMPQRPSMRGGLGQVGDQLRMMQKQIPGRRVAPPPNKFPGGGNPFMGGRNPMMAQSRRFGPGTYLR